MRKRISIPAILSSLTALGLLAPSGCTPSEPPRQNHTGASTQAPVANSATEPSALGNAEPSKKAAPSGAPKPLSPALADLKAKIQPPGAPQGKGPISPGETNSSATAPDKKAEEKLDGTPLLPAAEKLASALAAALEKDDSEAAAALCLSDNDLGKVLTPSYKDIIAGSLLPQNKAAFASYATTVKGKGAKPSFRPGKITPSPAKGALLPGIPIMSGAVLVLDLDGVKVEVRLEQLVHIQDEWRILRLGSP